MIRGNKYIPIVLCTVILVAFLFYEKNSINSQIPFDAVVSKIDTLSFDFEDSQTKEIVFKRCDTLYYSGLASSYVSSKDVYANGIKINRIHDVKDLIKIRAKAHVWGNKPGKNAAFTCSFSHDGEVYIWNIMNISKSIVVGQWNTFDKEYIVEQTLIPDEGDVELDFYTYNNAEDDFFIDDLLIELLFR